MKISKLSFSLVVVWLCILLQHSIFSQDGNKGTEKPLPKNLNSVPAELSNTLPENVSIVKQKPLSPDAIAIQEQMITAKQTGNVDEAIRLQYEMDRVTGNSETKPAELIEMTILKNNITEGITTDNPIHNTQVSSLRDITAIATATEQRGATAGRIWTAISSFDSYDRCFVGWYYSDNNGITWINYAETLLSNGSGIHYNSMDIEIIENYTGDKYIWLVYDHSFSGKAIVIDITNFGAVNFDLTWPGNNYRTKCTRITSDNSVYAGNPYIYITISSFTAEGYLVSRVAECLNPFTLSPNIVYRNTPFYNAFNGYYVEPNSDIAFYWDNGTPSIMMIEGVYGETYQHSTEYHYIYLSKASIWNFISGSVTGLSSINTNWDNRRHYIASSGKNGNLMIACLRNYMNIGDWDPVSYNTSNGGNSWSMNYIDGTSNPDCYLINIDLFSPREPSPNYSVAWEQVVKSTYYKTILRGVYTGSWGTDSVNHLPPAKCYGTEFDISPAPKPGYIYISGYPGMNSDLNSITFWPGNTINGFCEGENVWASYDVDPNHPGGKPTIIEEIVPLSFHLEQNYPNPFNPSTKISFSLPVPGNVRLTVFDISGREVKTLVNESKNAGYYEVHFDAAELSSGVYFYKLSTERDTETKKMLLVK